MKVRSMKLLAGAGDGSYRDLLNAYEFERTALIAFILEAQLYHLASALDQRVEALGLRVTAA